MTIRILLTGMTLLFLINIAEGQKKLREGYIITSESDTIYGLIEDRGDIKNGELCSFTKYRKEELTDFLPNDIIAYRFTNGKYYISKWIEPKDGEPNYFFVEFLVKGQVDLYYLRDGFGKDHYYIEKPDQQLVEMTNEQYIYERDGVEYQTTTNRHIGILKATLTEAPELVPKINKANLNHNSLIKIAKDYHEYTCNDGNCVDYTKDAPIFIFNYGFLIGLNSTKINSVDYEIIDPPFFSQMKYDPDQNIEFGGKVKAILPRISSKTSLNLSISYYKTSYYSNGIQFEGGAYNDINHEIAMDFHSLKNAITFMYNLNQKRISPFVHIGVNFDFLLNHKLEHYTEEIYEYNQEIVINEVDEIPIQKSYFGGYGGFGFDININNKLSFFLEGFYCLKAGYFKDDINNMNSYVSDTGIKIGLLIN